MKNGCAICGWRDSAAIHTNGIDDPTLLGKPLPGGTRVEALRSPAKTIHLYVEPLEPEQ